MSPKEGKVRGKLLEHEGLSLDLEISTLKDGVARIRVTEPSHDDLGPRWETDDFLISSNFPTVPFQVLKMGME